MPLPTAARDYLIEAVAGTPLILSTLLANRDDSDAVWDKRPDPERFTLREVLGHLADWEPIWVERISKIRKGDHPFLPSIDEGALAAENDYASSSPIANLKRFAEGRRATVDCLRSIRDEEWDLTCEREFVGPLTLQQQAYYILAHDGYHARQVAVWARG